MGMNIALLTQYYKPEMGAPQNRLYEMVSGLKNRGHDMCVVTAMPNYPTGAIFKDYKKKFSLCEKVDGIEVKRYWLYASNAKKTLPRIWNMFSFSLTSLCCLRYLRKKKTNILIVESPPLTLCITAYILARLSGAKLVTNISDLWPLSAKELGAVSEKSFVYRFLERVEKFVYRKSDLCMGQSAQIVDYIKQKGGKNVFLFRNGVDPSRFASVSHKPKKENAPIRIVYAGLLGFAQGIYSLCKNIDFKKLNVEFHIYGAGGEQTLLEEYLSTHPDCGIFFHGKVGRDDIPNVLAEADATLIPLTKPIFGAVPSKIYESMAAGVPILFSGGGEGEEIIKKYDLGWCAKAGDYATISDNIRMLVLQPETLAQKRENCHFCALNIFNRPKQIEALDYSLSSTVSRGKTPFTS